MKKILFYLLIFVGIAFIGSCDDNEDPAGRRDGIVPAVTNFSPSFFDLLVLEDAYVEFTIDLENKTGVDAVVIEGSYKDDLQRIEIIRVTSFPAVIRITAAEAAQKFGMSLDNLELGDMFTFEAVVVKGDQRTRSNAVVKPNIACSSDLEGVYSLTASGSGGGGLGISEPWTSKIESVTITSKDGGITYSIKPALGGIMVDFYSAYGATLVEGEFQDICGTISNPVINDGWNKVEIYTGEVDDETGVITISFENAWGDKGDMVLTPAG